MAGVPQGSVLGRCVFLFYSNDLPDMFASYVHLFADETVVYLAISEQQDTTTLQVQIGNKGTKVGHGIPSYEVSCVNFLQEAQHSKA